MPTTPLDALRGRETRWCRRANHYCRRRRVRHAFAVISRLGDGVFWYALMAGLVLLDGFDGLRASLHMAATGLMALLLYKGLKRWTRRPRPFAADLRIRAWVAPLRVPFTALIGLSRVVLGLHYPSDVLAATGIAALLAAASLQWLPL